MEFIVMMLSTYSVWKSIRDTLMTFMTIKVFLQNES